MIFRLALRSLRRGRCARRCSPRGFGLGIARDGGAARRRRRDPRAGATPGARRRRRCRHRPACPASSTSARFLTRGVLGAGPLASQVAVASPSMRAKLYSDRRARRDRGAGARRHPEPRSARSATRRRAASRHGRIPRPIARGPHPTAARCCARWIAFTRSPSARSRGVVGRVAVLQRPRQGRALLPDVHVRPARRHRPADVGVRLQLERDGRMTSLRRVHRGRREGTARDRARPHGRRQSRPPRWRVLPHRARSAGRDRRGARDRHDRARRHTRADRCAPIVIRGAADGSPATPCR